MKPFYLLLIVLLIASCTKKATLDKEAVSLQVRSVQMDVSHLNEIDWKIGLKKEADVTQSFTFIVDLPKLQGDDIDYLIENKDVDAWILRLIVERNSHTQDLGSLYALLRPRKIARGSMNAAGSVTFKVFYAAAYASQRFRAMKCPAFGHNKKISTMDIKGSNEEFSISFNQVIPYQEKSQLVELTPSGFNAGHSLIGSYYIEVAPYNSVKKQIYSSFKRIPMYIAVTEEETVSVKSCEGVHPEY